MKTLKNWLIRKLGGVERAKYNELVKFQKEVDDWHKDYVIPLERLAHEHGILKVAHEELKATHEEFKAKHEKYVKHVSEGFDLDHKKDGSGVANLIRSILFDTVQDTIGDFLSPMGGADYSDVIETNRLINDYAQSVADEISAFTYGIKMRDATEAKWGLPRVRVGISRMIAIGGGINSLIGKFARIWTKMHRDQRQKDVLTKEQIQQWRTLPAIIKVACNKAAKLSGSSIWDEFDIPF